jgi:DNA-binding XRE family transcriptional regulator
MAKGDEVTIMAATADARYGKWTRRSDLDEDRVARIRGKMEADVAAYRLREIREDQRRTQVDVAQQLGVTQKRVSEIESADILHTEYGTLARYVDALGGRLKLVADFGDHTVTLR